MTANGPPGRPPRLVLFDVDGTLVETGGAGRIAFVEVLEAMFPGDGVADAVAGVRFQGRTDPIIIDEIVVNAGLSAAFSTRRDEFWSRYVATLPEILRRPGLRRRALPGVEAMLQDLEGRAGVYLGLQTGNVEAGARAKLDALGLGRFFSEGGFASDHPDRRELVRMARDKLARRHGIPFSAHATVVVGDTEHDVRCARANGFRAVAVDSGWVARAELEAARPDALLDDFTDLAAVRAALGLD